jgi:uncharacterized repeat protein (TIGR01451 family)
MKQKLAYFWLITLIILTSVLSIFFNLNTAHASSFETAPPKVDQTNKPLLQTPITPTLTSTISNISTFSLTFTDLGFNETILTSPIDREKYAFRLPLNWELQAGSFIEFDLSYHYSSLNTSDELPMTFGDLLITLDDQIIKIFPIEEPNLDHYLLRVPIPPSLLSSLKQGPHTIELTLDAGYFCAIPHNATLIVHPTSFLSLNYTHSPLTLDLSTYPLPFYQRSFEPDEVIFGLPSQSSSAEAAGIVSLAAKLGHLTENRMVISATTDLNLVDLLSSPTPTFEHHLFVIGQPQNNSLVPFLNQVTKLPISLHERQMGLITQGPAAVSPGQVFTYTFTVTNTTNKSATLSLIDTIPAFTEFVACQPECLKENSNGNLTWAQDNFAPTENKSFFLVLKATEIITNPYLENTVTLAEAQLGPINGDSLVSQVSLNDLDDGEQQTSTTAKSKYFFVFNNEAVAESDGIIQEITSPWHKDRAILLVTGLNDDALRKASWAMSSEVRFPGLIGPVALVQDAFPPEIDEVPSPSIEMTFRDLGYDDEVIRGNFSQKTAYSFFLPLGWQLTDQAVLDLFFAHAEFAENTGGGFTVALNDTPIATVALSNETALGGSRQINLPASAARPGEQNRLTIQFIPVPGGSGNSCEEGGLFKDFWLVVKGDSKLSLDHTQDSESQLDLSLYPYPFNNNPSLIDLLFALPTIPDINEWENTLRLAASLGNSASGRTILPTVTLGDRFSGISLTGYHIIAIGRPSHNPLFQQVNSSLPQPFLPNSDEIQQQIDDFIFRLPPDIDLGYLELIPSSWNSERAFLAVTGTTDQGVTWAAQVLFSGRFKQLKGDLALIYGENGNNINTHDSSSEEVANVVTATVPTSTDKATVSDLKPPSTGTPPLTPVPTPEAEVADALIPDLQPLPTGALSLTPVPSSKAEVADALLVTTASNLPTWFILLAVIMVIIAVAVFVFGFVQSKHRI